MHSGETEMRGRNRYTLATAYPLRPIRLPPDATAVSRTSKDVPSANETVAQPACEFEKKPLAERKSPEYFSFFGSPGGAPVAPLGRGSDAAALSLPAASPGPSAAGLDSLFLPLSGSGVVHSSA
jgi:hypothetical protein